MFCAIYIRAANIVTKKCDLQRFAFSQSMFLIKFGSFYVDFDLASPETLKKS